MRVLSVPDEKNLKTFNNAFEKIVLEAAGDNRSLVAMWKEAWSKLTELIHDAHSALPPGLSTHELFPSKWLKPLIQCYIRYDGGSKPFTMCAVVPISWKDGSQMMFFAYDVRNNVVKQFHTALVTQVVK